MTPDSVSGAVAGATVRVWDLPTRLFHWALVACVACSTVTGYLGGAVATHVRVEHPVFSHTLFPVYVALLLWGGLWLRSERLRKLIPLTA